MTFRSLLSRSFSSNSKTVGILREGKNRWECRVAFTPQNILELKNKYGDALKFVIQPSRKRIFRDDEFRAVGAKIQQDLSGCDIIFGIKEVSIDKLISNKSYIMFSHTHKGQYQNVPLLKEICEKNITLYDYELLADEATGRRMVAFGTHAGYSGMMMALHGLGDRLLTRGIRTPFIHIPFTHNYRNLQHARDELVLIGNDIKAYGINREFGPIVFTFTGSGNVSQGAREIFSLLPHEWIEAKNLKSFVESGKFANDRLYGCLVTAPDYLKNRLAPEKPFEMTDYLKNPENYESHFHESIAPYTTTLVNGIYWEARYPRLLTKEQMKEVAKSNGGKCRLLSIADISCDLDGSIEFMKKASTIDVPFYYYDALREKYSESFRASGVQIMSIDNLPTQLPQDSSEHFGRHLLPLVAGLANIEKNPIVEGAKIVDSGRIVERFSSLNTIVKRLQSKKRILILGSGYVVPTVINYLGRFEDTLELTVASDTIDAAAKTLRRESDQISLIRLDVLQDAGLLEKLIGSSDVVISLLAATMHVPIAQACIRQKKHLVTASYISKEMEGLDSAAKAAGIMILNEIGLDPGLDHLSAMEVIDEARARGETVESFVSWCGGLPAPENCDNFLGYKFSWSPRGVLMAALNSAEYLENGQVKRVSGDELLLQAQRVSLHPALRLEGIPNRDSMKYVSLYGLSPKDVKTMFRGTLRYEGFCKYMNWFRELGFLSLKTEDAPPTPVDPKGFVEGVLKGPLTIEHLSCKLPDLREEELRDLHSALSWLIAKATDVSNNQCPLDAFSALLQDRLRYENGERDLVLLEHEFLLRKGTDCARKLTVRMLQFGDEKHSAMARTVGYPVAVAARLMANGDFKGLSGVMGPLQKALYQPILQELRLQCGIVFEKNSSEL